jgi:transcriptional regulator with XRE-family HTH domain
MESAAVDFDREGFDREVGLRLQLARKGAGFTQAELARRIGLPRPSYANIESGRQRVPVDVVWRAAVILDVPLSSLVPEPIARREDPSRRFPIAASFIQWSPTAPGNAEE